MDETQQILSAAAAFYFGRGYYVNTNVTIPGRDTVVDLAAVMPRMSELKLRMKRGFAPTGIINHLFRNQWFSLSRLVEQTGYLPEFIAAVMYDAAQDNWVESKSDGTEIFYRVKDYRVPARACLAAFSGMKNLAEKIDLAMSLSGCFHQLSLFFPIWWTTAPWSDSHQSGRHHTIPPKAGRVSGHYTSEQLEIEDLPGHASLVEAVLYDNVWLMNQELI